MVQFAKVQEAFNLPGLICPLLYSEVGRLARRHRFGVNHCYLSMRKLRNVGKITGKRWTIVNAG